MQLLSFHSSPLSQNLLVYSMARSLEHYEDATSGIPVKVLGTQIDGTNGAATLQLEEADKHDQVLRVFRCLIADLCEQFKGGHPGGKPLVEHA